MRLNSSSSALAALLSIIARLNPPRRLSRPAPRSARRRRKSQLDGSFAHLEAAARAAHARRRLATLTKGRGPKVPACVFGPKAALAAVAEAAHEAAYGVATRPQFDTRGGAADVALPVAALDPPRGVVRGRCVP